MFYLTIWEDKEDWHKNYYHIFYADSWEEAKTFCQNHINKYEDYSLDEYSTIEELKKDLEEIQQEIFLIKET
mgnify:CR=1 FL=1